jgi:hypothetical protein
MVDQARIVSCLQPLRDFDQEWIFRPLRHFSTFLPRLPTLLPLLLLGLLRQHGKQQLILLRLRLDYAGLLSKRVGDSEVHSPFADQSLFHAASSRSHTAMLPYASHRRLLTRERIGVNVQRRKVAAASEAADGPYFVLAPVDVRICFVDPPAFCRIHVAAPRWPLRRYPISRGTALFCFL